MENCFTFVCSELEKHKIKVPIEWGGFSRVNKKLFIVDYKYFLENKLHYEFFYSFCNKVSTAQKNDIILDNDGIGIAINRFKYMTIKDKNNKHCLSDIVSGQTILRVNNG